MTELVLARIRTLWAYRAWYRSHLGWIPQQQIDDRAEIRYLIGLLREWRWLEATRSDSIAQPDHPADATWTNGELAEAWGK